jgi:hypothetical protein
MSDGTKHKKKAIPKVVKDLSWNKWVGEDVAKCKCLCCGVNEIKMSSFHCGHIIAEAHGGLTSVENLKPICAACNLSMGSENFDAFKKRCGFTCAEKKVAVAAPAPAPAADPKPKVKKPTAAELKAEKIAKLVSEGKLKPCPGKDRMVKILPGITHSACGLNPFSFWRHCDVCSKHYLIENGKKVCPCGEL